MQRQIITPRGLKIVEGAAKPFEALNVARNLLRTAPSASLATLDPSGYPYGTMTNIAVEPSGTPYFFTANLALHARNIAADNRVSLVLFPPGKPDVLTQPRLTLVGRARRLAADEIDRAKARYAARFPKAKLYLSLPDAMLYRLLIEDLRFNGGPARNAVTDVTPEMLRTDLSGAEALLDAEDALVDRLNATAGLPKRLADRAGAKAGNWAVCGIDPDGIDLTCAHAHARLWFAVRVTAPQELWDVVRTGAPV
ncbi:HugZ family pyridoxamine 5'-phosphate oxidase [Chelatococcus reniformis]|uniref:HugZ family pyridoxamine 5'-phosphate oxidase n=1 Tax=Chelatococcus reniformis TaxID=1494448 RepID=UPI001FCE7591|nr:pyridoxamine 5'-phosphate oxidase family protein [Chelatococcus reniformis]